MATMVNASGGTLAITPARLAILVVYGAMLWAVGAVVLRLAAGAHWFGGPLHIVLYLMLFPATWPFVRYAPQLAGLPRAETLRSTAIALTTALFIDGVVIGFAPAVYSSDPATALACAGAILWGAGVALVLGLILQPRA